MGVPARHRELGLDVLRALGLEARVALRVVGHDRLDRVDQVLVERRDRAAYRFVPAAVRVGREHRRRRLQREDGERLRARRDVAEQRRVGQRGAAHLRGDRLRQPALTRLVVRRLELGVRRADVQRPGERHGRVDAGLEPRQPVEQQVDLELGALGLRLRVVGLAQQDVQHPGRHVREHERRLDGGRAARGVEVDLVEVVAGPDRRDTGADADLGPGRRSRPGERVAERAHAAQGHQLLAGAVADQPVEEAAVLLQRRVVQRPEHPDQRVGRHDAAHGVVGEPLLDHLAQRRGDEVAPGRLVHVRGHVLLPGQRLQEGRLDRPGHVRHLGVEAAPRVVLAAAVGQLEERGAGALALRVLDQQPAVPAVAEAGRVRRDRPRRERHVELELGHQPRRHQGDQVGVARDAGGPAGERLRRDGRAADPVEPLEDQHRESRPGEVRRCHKAVVARLPRSRRRTARRRCEGSSRLQPSRGR